MKNLVYFSLVVLLLGVGIEEELLNLRSIGGVIATWYMTIWGIMDFYSVTTIFIKPNCIVIIVSAPPVIRKTTYLMITVSVVTEINWVCWMRKKLTNSWAIYFHKTYGIVSPCDCGAYKMSSYTIGQWHVRTWHTWNNIPACYSIKVAFLTPANPKQYNK